MISIPRVLLALALLSTGCASLPPAPGQGMNLRYAPHEAVTPASAEGAGVEPLSVSGTPRRLHRRRALREEVTAVGPDSAEREARQRALAAQLAFRGALREVTGSTRRISSELARLNASVWGLAQGNRVFVRYADYGEAQLRWIEDQLAAATRLANEFCVMLEQAHHEAIHGGGNWKLGRMWPGEWNRMIMEALYEAETTAGRMLTRNEVLETVAKRMKDYDIPMNFVPWRGP